MSRCSMATAGDRHREPAGADQRPAAPEPVGAARLEADAGGPGPARGQADIVLFDTPPALAVTDAAVLSTRTDGVLMVTDASKTRRSAARQAVEGLTKVGAKLTGVAVNRLSPRGSAGTTITTTTITPTPTGRTARGGGAARSRSNSLCQHPTDRSTPAALPAGRTHPHPVRVWPHPDPTGIGRAWPPAW